MKIYQFQTTVLLKLLHDLWVIGSGEQIDYIMVQSLYCEAEEDDETPSPSF